MLLYARRKEHLQANINALFDRSIGRVSATSSCLSTYYKCRYGLFLYKKLICREVYQNMLLLKEHGLFAMFLY